MSVCFFSHRLAESSAQSSSQSEDDDAEFIKMHMSDRRRWQGGGSAVSRRLARLFGYMVVVNGTAHSGPSTAHAQGSASAPRTGQGAHRGFQSEEPSRAVSKPSVALAPPVCHWDAGNNCGQMVLDTGQARASTRLSADASGFIKCHWEVDGIVNEWLSEAPVLDLLTCFRLFCCNLQMPLVTTHTSMIDVADLSMFRLLQTPSWAAKPPAATAVERVVKENSLCPQTAICAAEGHSSVEVLGTQPRVHQRLQAQA